MKLFGHYGKYVLVEFLLLLIGVVACAPKLVDAWLLPPPFAEWQKLGRDAEVVLKPRDHLALHDEVF